MCQSWVEPVRHLTGRRFSEFFGRVRDDLQSHLFFIWCRSFVALKGNQVFLLQLTQRVNVITFWCLLSVKSHRRARHLDCSKQIIVHKCLARGTCGQLSFRMYVWKTLIVNSRDMENWHLAHPSWMLVYLLLETSENQKFTWLTEVFWDTTSHAGLHGINKWRTLRNCYQTSWIRSWRMLKREEENRICCWKQDKFSGSSHNIQASMKSRNDKNRTNHTKYHGTGAI